MRNDPDQQAAIAVTTNTVVSAGAGSGKTSVLTRRYVRLVTEQRMRINEILALTFTRKAAAEMYERIYRELLERSDDPFVREQLSSFDEAMIATLDSFCAAVARNGCARFGIPATFSVDEDALASLCERLALTFLAEHADDPAIADLIRLNGFTRLWKDGFARLAAEHARVSDVGSFADALPVQRAFLDSERARLVDEYARITAEIMALDPDGPSCIADAQTILSGFDPSAALDDPEHGLAPLAGIRLQCGSSKHPDVPLLKLSVGELRELTERAQLIGASIAGWEGHEAVMRLLDEFRSRVVTEKRRTALLSYHDVTGLAIRSLVEDPGLRALYKRRYRAIMIDEFQDNNEEQKALLYLLSEAGDRIGTRIPEARDLDPGKLFFVGDEKQSIYRFRGADVSVFRTLAQDLAGPRAGLRLGANYRSEPGMIRFFNALFGRVFADAEQPYEARFEPLRSRDASPGVMPRVELWQLDKRPSSDETYLADIDAEAFHIARFIRSAVDDGSLIVGAGADPSGVPLPGRAAGYDDFAILLRSSGNQIRLERMLRLFGIPYHSQAARSLFLEAPVNDIYQALQLVVYPDDRVACAGFLRSPLVGLSDDGLVRQMLSDEPFLQPCAGHAADDLRRLDLARSRYEELCRTADSAPIAELLHHIWYRWGYRYHLMRRREHGPYLEYYDLFRELALRYEEQGLAAFLDEVRRHIGQNEKLNELEVIGGESSGVQIMTIHRAKGLEFPVVIVANAGNRGRNASMSAQPFYRSQQLGIAFNTGFLPRDAVREKPANYLYRHERDEHEAQEFAELKRLLYVAATRAESHLVISGLPVDADRSLTGIVTPAFTAAMESLADDPGLHPAVRTLDAVRVEEEAHAQRSGGSRDIAELARAYGSVRVISRRYEPVEVTATELNRRATACEHGGTSVAVESPPHPLDELLARADLAATFGSYCHHCIEHGLANLPSPEEVPTRLRPDLPAAGLGLFLRSGYELARAFLDSPAYAALSRATSVEHELGFMLHGGNRPEAIIRGQIDLVAEFEDHVLVLDFKTDRLLRPEEYRVQMDVYREAARELYGKPAVVDLVHLRSGTVVRM